MSRERGLIDLSKKDFELNIGGNKQKKENPLQERNLLKRGSFVTPELSDLKQKKERETKIVNTKVPKNVFTAFLMFCAKKNQFRKDIYPEMLNYLLAKYENKKLSKHSILKGEAVDYAEMMIVNFEYDVYLERKVKELKAREHVKYQDIYTQAIIQYINDKEIS